jgi:hypothetical protein
MSTPTPLVLEDMPRYTAWGAILQVVKIAEVPMLIIDQTALNETLGVYPAEVGDHTKAPSLNYFGIGYGSTYTRPNSQGVDESVNYVHDPLDAGMFHPTPIVMREQGKDDLTAEQRARLGMRSIMNHGGKTYVCYNLKKLDRSASVVQAFIVTPADSSDPSSTEIRTPVTGDPRYLNPTPVKLTNDTVRKDGSYVSIKCNLGMVFNTWELNEIIKAKQILTGSSLEITEIGIFSAYSASKTVPDGTSSITYTEAIEAQLAIVMPTRIIASHYLDEGLTLYHDVGISNPTNFARPF